MAIAMQIGAAYAIVSAAVDEMRQIEGGAAAAFVMARNTALMAAAANGLMTVPMPRAGAAAAASQLAADLETIAEAFEQLGTDLLRAAAQRLWHARRVLLTALAALGYGEEGGGTVH
jgi:nitroreductase